ncbi:hypothetical protein ACNPQM_30565 [Streptomyces sp. NPDC056231]|uniref:hypothetical protein n=1 Tax=Streptomyces sp. NPDC056231 TaxID=3345755 RepID=UPI003AACD9A6
MSPGPYGCDGGILGTTIGERGRTPLDLDELVERWALLKDEQVLVSGKRGATRLGFAILLKFYAQ